MSFLPYLTIDTLLLPHLAATAAPPQWDVFSVPPICPASLEAAAPAAASASVFFDDTPEFQSSELRARLFRQWETSCKKDCPFDSIFSHHRKHYESLDRVVVMDMSGLGPLNGLGNTLAYYIHFLKHSILLGRAAFLRRNLPECEPHCSFDPGDFFGAFGGVDYRWSNATACAVARVMALRGEKEHVVSLVFNRSSDAHETVGAFDETTGDFVEGDFDFFSLLSHPRFAKLPWVRFLLPPDSRKDGPGAAGWNLEVTVSSTRHKYGVPDDVRAANPDLYRAACLGGDATRDVDSGPAADVEQCGMAAFFHPAPRLQRLLAPLLPALDDTRRRCGALTGIHLRSGFADMVGSVEHLLHHRHDTGGERSNERESAAEAVRNAWAVLSNATRPCPQRCHVGKPPDPSKLYLDDSAPGCLPDGLEDKGEICMDWQNNQLALWAAQEVQANHDAHISAADAGRGAPAGGRFDIGADEVGRDLGLGPTMLTFAAWKAREIAANRSVLAPHPACADPSSPAGAAGAAADDAWRIVVAGDLPLFVATAHASPSLRGRVVDAGRGAGRIGHVGVVGDQLQQAGDGACGDDISTTNASARREACGGDAAGTGGGLALAAAEAHRKQLGAWSRSVLDLYLLSICDYIVSAGSSSFISAAQLMQLPGFTWLDRGDFFFFNRLRMSGHYVMPREGEVGWGLPLYVNMAEAIERLESAGLGGSGVAR